MQRSRIGSVAATAFLNYPPPSAKDDAHGRTTGGKRPNRSERHVWRSESQTCKPHKQVTLSALSNEDIENNRSHIDPSRCRSSLSFGNLRKLSWPCVTDTWSARFALRVSVTSRGTQQLRCHSEILSSTASGPNSHARARVSPAGPGRCASRDGTAAHPHPTTPLDEAEVPPKK